ncbi:MAG: methylmalonyl-CoA mutase family protein [Planctomycetota bacterium]|jgi:methylmalonyl-CoA mutase|nr:methylmalonyl-CoA mutase family protein [Planctomycetota bacterium]
MTAESVSVLDDFPAVDYQVWREMVEADLKGAPFDKKLVTRLYEGIAVQPLYTKNDAIDALGVPGFAPLTRGASPLGASGRGWDIRQELDHPCLKRGNELALAELSGGANSLRLRWNGSSRTSGIDFDGACGDGITAATVDELDRLLNDVDLTIAPIGLDAGAGAIPAAACYLAVLDRRQVPADAARAELGIDPLGTLAATGALGSSASTVIAQAAGIAANCAARYPGVRALTASSVPYHEAGAHAVQELAAVVATGATYLRACEEAGLSPQQAAGQIALEVAVGCDQFLEIAKIRALRRIWGRILEACGVSADTACIKVLTTTSRRMLTQRDPWVNMLRTTVTTFAAAVGGADAVTVLPFDAQIGVSPKHTRRVARNTQVVLHEEAHLDHVVDPGGGSWYLESLTNELAQAAWTQFQAIEGDGGILAALGSGSLSGAIAESWQARRANLAKRKDPITGVSEYPNVTETTPKTEQPDLALIKRDCDARLAASSPAAANAVAQLNGAEAGAKLDALVAAAAAGASIGALNAALATSDGAEIDALPVHTFAEDFERLRAACDAKPPKAFLANMGPLAHHTVRASWSTNFLQAGGLDVISNDGFKEADAAAAAFKESGASIAVICSSDKLYPDLAVPTAKALKAAGANSVILAGRPADDDTTKAWTEAGVDRFIYLGVPVLDVLTELLTKEGVLA